ncbi:serine hydrolase, partial [Acinetobacter baumannii]
GTGFGLGFAVLSDPAKALSPSPAGEYFWGGAASTACWIDPREELAVIFMTQLLPSSAYPIRRDLRTLVYAAIEESLAG